MENKNTLTPFSPDYGTSKVRNQVVNACVFLLAVVLYLLPHVPNAAMDVHKAIAESLLAGNNWGRQALVGNLEYPVLPSLALLLAEFVARWVHLDGARLMIAVCQAMALGYFMRCVMSMKHFFAVLFPVAVVLVIPFLRNAFLGLDPGWLAAVLLCSVFYHLVTWQHAANLRDVILVSGACGLLMLCGPAAAFTGLLLAIVLYYQVRRRRLEDGQDAGGMRTLLGAAPVYCVVIWFLWNWLVMDDVFFGLREFSGRWKSLGADDFSRELGTHRHLVFACLAFAAPLAIAATKSRSAAVAKCLLSFLPALCIGIPLSAAMKTPMTALWPMAAMLMLSVFVLYLIAEFEVSVPRTAGAIAALLCAVATFRAQTLNDPSSIPPQAPSREEITSYIDQFWPESRTMLYGLRLPALYPDSAEKRFVARLDYQEKDFLVQAQDEQLHILVPPPDGRFYPGKSHPLAQIWANGKTWLLLEKQWDGGWQLWRAVPPPDKESRLDFLR